MQYLYQPCWPRCSSHYGPRSPLCTSHRGSKQGCSRALQASSFALGIFRSVVALVGHEAADQSRVIVRGCCKRGCRYERYHRILGAVLLCHVMHKVFLCDLGVCTVTLPSPARTLLGLGERFGVKHNPGVAITAPLSPPYLLSACCEHRHVTHSLVSTLTMLKDTVVWAYHWAPAARYLEHPEEP